MNSRRSEDLPRFVSQILIRAYNEASSDGFITGYSSIYDDGGNVFPEVVAQIPIDYIDRQGGYGESAVRIVREWMHLKNFHLRGNCCVAHNEED